MNHHRFFAKCALIGLAAYAVAGALIAFMPNASAQETYSIPASAGNVTTLTAVINGFNGDTCARWNLARTCTQAQVCVAASAPGGASCTAAQARGVKVRIYPSGTQAGREEFTQFEVALAKFNDLVGAQQQENRRAMCVAWTAANTTQRNLACTDLGLASGCDFGC